MVATFYVPSMRYQSTGGTVSIANIFFTSVSCGRSIRTITSRAGDESARPPSLTPKICARYAVLKLRRRVCREGRTMNTRAWLRTIDWLCWKEDARVIHFVNADLIAGGLSPLKPELAAIAAARVVLREIDRLATAREDFAFETTLSGLTYVQRLKKWKRAGYRIGHRLSSAQGRCHSGTVTRAIPSRASRRARTSGDSMSATSSITATSRSTKTTA